MVRKIDDLTQVFLNALKQSWALLDNFGKDYDGVHQLVEVMLLEGRLVTVQINDANEE